MNNSSDHSLCTAEMWTWSALFFLESIAIIFANCVTVHIFWHQRKTLSRTSYLLVNLALADLTVGLSAGCFALENQISSYTGVKPTGIGCLSADVLLETASLTFLVVLALESMPAVFWPQHHRLAKTRTCLYFTCIGWLFFAATTVTFILSYFRIIIRMILTASFYMFYIITMILLSVTICVVYFTMWLRLKYTRK